MRSATMIDLQHHTVRPRRATIAAIVTIAVSALAACGGGDDASKSPSPPPSALVSTAAPAASRAQDVLGAQNDSGDIARVFAVGLDGAALATYTLNGAEAI